MSDTVYWNGDTTVVDKTQHVIGKSNLHRFYIAAGKTVEGIEAIVTDSRTGTYVSIIATTGSCNDDALGSVASPASPVSELASGRCDRISSLSQSGAATITTTRGEFEVVVTIEDAEFSAWDHLIFIIQLTKRFGPHNLKESTDLIDLTSDKLT